MFKINLLLHDFCLSLLKSIQYYVNGMKKGVTIFFKYNQMLDQNLENYCWSV